LQLNATADLSVTCMVIQMKACHLRCLFQHSIPFREILITYSSSTPINARLVAHPFSIPVLSFYWFTSFIFMLCTQCLTARSIPQLGLVPLLMQSAATLTSSRIILPPLTFNTLQWERFMYVLLPREHAVALLVEALCYWRHAAA
jgi:hypothetical protein